MSGLPISGVRVAGFLAGLCLVGLLTLLSWRVPAVSRPAPVAVELRTVDSGEVGVQPAGAVVRGGSLAPGGAPVTGRVRLANRTAGTLTAAARLRGGEGTLDRLVEATLVVRGRTVFRGPVGGLRERSRVAIALEPGGAADLEVQLRLPPAAASEAAARSARWSLTFAEDAR